MLETNCFFIVVALFEGIGVYGIDFLMEQLGLMPEDVVIGSSIEVAFSKLVLIFFYYALMRRLWKKDYRQSRTQVILYLVMFLYSIVNLLSLQQLSQGKRTISCSVQIYVVSSLPTCTCSIP